MGFDWLANFQTGYQAVDATRRDLFDTLHDYSERAAVISADENVLGEAIDLVVGWLHDYMDGVTDMLRAEDCPHHDQHVATHEELKRLVIGYKASYQANPPGFDFKAFIEFTREQLRLNTLTTHVALSRMVEQEPAA